MTDITDDLTTQIAKAIQAKTGGNVEGKLPEWWAEFIGMVLAELQSAGRLLGDDETRLTAEQVEDLRTVLNKFGFNQVTPKVIQAIEAAERLNRALFPATEPAEEETKAESHMDKHGVIVTGSPVVPAPTETGPHICGAWLTDGETKDAEMILRMVSINRHFSEWARNRCREISTTLAPFVAAEEG